LPIFATGVFNAETMRKKITITAFLGVAMLLVAPFSWGCDLDDPQDCSMVDCPMMPDTQADTGCHEPMESEGHAASGCSQGPDLWVSCCDSPLDREVALIDSAAAWDGGATPLIQRSEPLQAERPRRPPDRLPEAILSRQHLMGRYTLLATFLL
jgi:hypothetical protein